jgi:hypothetical protein
MIILAAYINTNNIHPEARADYMKNIQEIISKALKKKNVEFFIFPVDDQPTKIECIYPRFLVAENNELKLEFKKYDALIKNLSKYIKIYSEKM